jgi:hypothetical protein
VTAAPPPVALTAAPARIELAGAAGGVLRVTNPGRSPVVIEAAPAGFALDLGGRPRIVARDPDARISVRPGRVALGAGRSASLAVSSAVSSRARAGDHEALVLLTARPRGSKGVGVRMRLGVVVIVRVAGAVVHRLEPMRVQVKRGRLAVTVRNLGNVVEAIGPQSFRVMFRRGGRMFATLAAARRELLPGARGFVEIRRPPRLRGRFRVLVDVRDGAGVLVRRAFAVRVATTGRGG